jgi:hypothetical protein
MSTHARIFKAYPTQSGEYILDGVYCHFDGYPSHVGKMLKDYYQDESKIDSLISLGNMSYLDKEIFPHSENHSYKTPDYEVSVFYGRDRGESHHESARAISPTLDLIYEILAFSSITHDADYTYVRVNSVWFILCDGSLTEITDEFLENCDD